MELVTIGLITFNQERTVRSALESLLAQTYSPLEIVISDDASTDGTFRELEGIVAGYGGPHSVKLHRNEVNLGIGGNVNRVFEEARGELVVLAAGDDISDPDRVECVVTKWLELEKPSAVFSGVRLMDNDGKILRERFQFLEAQLAAFDDGRDILSSGELIELMEGGVYVAPSGCSAAWHADVFRIFGPLREGVIFEDRAFSFRASLMHGMGVVREDLVSYRINEFSASKTEAGFGAAGIRNFREKLGARCRRERNFLAVYHGMARDLAVARAKGLLPGATADRVEAAVSAKIEECETKLDWWKLGLVEKCRSMKCAPLRSRLGKLLCLLPLKV